MNLSRTFYIGLGFLLVLFGLAIAPAAAKAAPVKWEGNSGFSGVQMGWYNINPQAYYLNVRYTASYHENAPGGTPWPPPPQYWPTESRYCWTTSSSCNPWTSGQAFPNPWGGTVIQASVGTWRICTGSRTGSNYAHGGFQAFVCSRTESPFTHLTATVLNSPAPPPPPPPSNNDPPLVYIDQEFPSSSGWNNGNLSPYIYITAVQGVAAATYCWLPEGSSSCPTLYQNLTTTPGLSPPPTQIYATQPLTQDGSWKLCIKAKSALQGVAGWNPDPGVCREPYKRDTVAPNAPGTPTFIGSPSNSTITVSWGAATDPNPSGANQVSGIGTYELQYTKLSDNSTGTVTTGATSVILNLSEGQYTFRVRARDNAGNFSGYSGISGVATFDKTAPSITTLIGTTPTRNRPVISWTGNDTGGSGINRYEVWRRTLSGNWALINSNATSPWTDNTSGLTPEIYLYGIHAIDNAGNCIDESDLHCGGVTFDALDYLRAGPGPLRIVYDTTPPQAPTLSPPGDETYTCSPAVPLTISGSATDVASPTSPPVRIHFTVDTAVSGVDLGAQALNNLASGAPRVLQASSPTCASPEQPLEGVTITQDSTVNMVACDAAGNQSAVTSGLYTCDTSPPGITFIPSQRGWQNSNISLRVSAFDENLVSYLRHCWTVDTSGWCDPGIAEQNSSGWTWTEPVQGCDGSSRYCTGTQNWGLNGTYYLCVRARDTLGNWSSRVCSGPQQRDNLVPTTPSVVPCGSGSATTCSPTRFINPTVQWTPATDVHSGVANYSVCYYNSQGQSCGACSVTNGTIAAMPVSCFTGQMGQDTGAAPLHALFAWLGKVIDWLMPALRAAVTTPPTGIDGTYRFVIQAVDRAGNYSSPLQHNVIIDTTPPSAPVIRTNTASPPYSTLGPTQDITPTVYWNAVSDANLGGYCVNFFQENTTTPSGRLQCGGVCLATTSTNVTMPDTCYNPPVGGGQVSSTFPLSQPLAWFSTIVNKWLPTVLAATSTGVGGGPGTYSFDVTAYDTAGNISVTSTYSLILDTVPPNPLIVQMPPTTLTPTNNTNPLVQWAAPYDISGNSCGMVEFFRGGGTTVGSGGTSCSAFCPSVNWANLGACYQGNNFYRAELQSQDGAGNLGSKIAYWWYVDTTPPTLTLSATIANTGGTTTAIFQGPCSDNFSANAVVYLEVVGPEPGDLIDVIGRCEHGGLVPINVDVTSFGDGQITGQVTVVDDATNQSQWPYTLTKDTVGLKLGVDLFTDVNPNTPPGRNYYENGDNTLALSTDSNLPTLIVSCNDCVPRNYPSPTDPILDWARDGQPLLRTTCSLIGGKDVNVNCGYVDNATLQINFIQTPGWSHNGLLQFDLSQVFKDTAGNPAMGILNLTIDNEPPVIILK